MLVEDLECINDKNKLYNLIVGDKCFGNRKNK